MLIETIKQRVIDRKVLITILLVCLAWVADVLCYKDILNHALSFNIAFFCVFCIFGTVSTIIVVPLLYDIPIPIKNRIACAVLRGLLGAYLIMLSAWLCYIISFIFEQGLDTAVEALFSMFAVAALMLPFFMIGILTENIGYVCFVFTICTISSFMIAELVDKRFPSKGGNL